MASFTHEDIAEAFNQCAWAWGFENMPFLEDIILKDTKSRYYGIATVRNLGKPNQQFELAMNMSYYAAMVELIGLEFAEEFWKQVVIHELAHICCWQFGLKHENHGHFFSKLVRDAGGTHYRATTGDYREMIPGTNVGWMQVFQAADGMRKN